MKGIKICRKILQSALLMLLTLILLCNLYTICARDILNREDYTIFGWTWAVVITGSMEPVISGNDLVVTKAHENYSVNDIIMFESGNMLVTHRIVDETEKGFITKGDANNTEDILPVTSDKVLGKVMCIIPGVGVLMGYLKTPLGLLCVVLIGVLLIEIPYLLENRKKIRRKGCE